MTEEKVRIDKWLWAARFFKTRSLASKAVSGGHVHINGLRIKPARPVQVGDRLHIRRGLIEFEVIVEDLLSRRGPAAIARTMYTETAESESRRQKAADERRLRPDQAVSPNRRPDKRDRRKIRRFIRKD